MMKKFIIVTVLFLSSFAMQAQKLKWESFEDAQIVQKNNSKPIFLLASRSKEDPFTRKLIGEIVSNSELKNFLNDNFTLSFFNVFGGEVINYKGKEYINPNLNKKGKCPNHRRDCSHDFTKFVLAVEAFPSIYIFYNSGKMSEPIVGMRNSEELLEVIKSLYENN